MKKLIRDHSKESQGILPSARSKKDQEPQKPSLIGKSKISDIYNIKQTNKLILYQSGDKRVKAVDPLSRNYILVNSAKVNADDDFEP